MRMTIYFIAFSEKTNDLSNLTLKLIFSRDCNYSQSLAELNDIAEKMAADKF